jgi:hypothetical protein
VGVMFLGGFPPIFLPPHSRSLRLARR